MKLDPTIKRSILRALARDRHTPVPGAALAEQAGVDVDLAEAYVDAMEGAGEVWVSRAYGNRWAAQITSQGYLEAHSPNDEAPEETAEPQTDMQAPTGDTRGRLQKQLDELEGLIGRGRGVTLDDMKRWVYWTLTVVKRSFGENSQQARTFGGVTGGSWPFGYEGAERDGYRERLPEWRRLLATWIREIDEFETPGQAVEQYIAPGSQFSAYVVLKDTLERATSSITLVDPYTGDATLQPLLSVDKGVHVRVLTVNFSTDFAHALQLFRQEWPGNIEARQGSKDLHDRFLLVDDRVFFSGASFKDLGRKGSVIAEIRTDAMKKLIRKDIEASWKAAQPIV